MKCLSKNTMILGFSTCSRSSNLSIVLAISIITAVAGKATTFCETIARKSFIQITCRLAFIFHVSWLHLTVYITICKNKLLFTAV